MKRKPFLPLALSIICFLISSCEKSERTAEPPNQPVPPTAEEKEEPTSKIEAIDKPDIFAEEAIVAEDEIALNQMPPEQRKTLEAALSKAVEDIDIKLLLKSLGGDGQNSSVRFLTGTNVTVLPSNGKKISQADLEKLLGPAMAHTQLPETTIGENGEKQIHLKTLAFDPIMIDSTEDTEASKNIQQHLQSGNSEGLAKELSKLIQSGVDIATMQQLGVGSETSPNEDATKKQP